MAETKIICDTDVMIDYFDAKKTRHDLTRSVLEQRIGLDNVVLATITKMELITGASNKSELNTISKKLNRFDVLMLDPEVTLLSLTLLQTYHLSHGLMVPDCLIAATVLRSGLQFYTYNTKHFKFIPKLKLYKY